MPDQRDDADLIRKTASLLYGHITLSPEIQAFLESNLAAFAPLNATKDDNEHRLEWTSLFQQYEAIMEDKLHDISKSLGFSSTKEYFSALQDRIEEDDAAAGGGREAKMLNLVLASMEYTKFVALMQIKYRSA